VTRRRRANGEGAIWQEGAYHVGRITLDGCRYQVKGKTQEGVADKLFALKQKAAAGTLTETRRKCTVGEWLDEWLGGLFVEPKTLQGYREHVRKHLAPAFGRMQLSSLTTQQIRAFCQQKMLPKDQGGAGLHQTTVHNIGMTLRIALGAAVELGLIAKNPAAVRKTTPPPASREMLTWERDECQRFLAAAAGHQHEVLFHFALATGARQGEIRALRWSAIDLDAGTVSIKASMSTGRRRKRTKTDSGERLLHLPPHLVQLLAGRKAARAVVYLDQDELVFPNDAGNPFSGCNLRVRTMEPLMRKAQVRRIRFHDLRHTFATLMLRSGVPVKDVAYMLGHSDAATTIRVYAHAIPSTHGAHAAVMGAILTGEPTQTLTVA
jgi:integrase